jgi:hypothetical protein
LRFSLGACHFQTNVIASMYWPKLSPVISVEDSLIAVLVQASSRGLNVTPRGLGPWHINVLVICIFIEILMLEILYMLLRYEFNSCCKRSRQ